MDRFPPQEECNRCGEIIGPGGCACTDEHEQSIQESLNEAQKEEDRRTEQ